VVHLCRWKLGRRGDVRLSPKRRRACHWQHEFAVLAARSNSTQPVWRRT
jgi:hypothetical protein